MIRKISAYIRCLSLKSYLLFLVVVLSASALTAQAGPKSPPAAHAETADFLGTVVDAAEKPLEGVHVTLTIYGREHQATVTYGSMSNEKGRVFLPQVSPGTYAPDLEKP